MAPDAIPEAIFAPDASGLPESLRSAAADQLALQETFGILNRHSLVKRSGGYLSVHRLVQEVVRMSMAEQTMQDRVTSCVRLLGDAFLSFENVTPTRGSLTPSTLLPHALKLVQYATVVDSQAADRLLAQSATQMSRQAQLQGAPMGLQHAQAIAVAAYGQHDPRAAHGLVTLGHALEADPANWAAAWACYERALAIAEPVYGSEHPDVVALLNDLGSVLRKLGDLARARIFLDRALAIQKRGRER
jgi:hypothetical protein